MLPGCSGLGRTPTKPQPYDSRFDKLGTCQRNQDAPGKTNRHQKGPQLSNHAADFSQNLYGDTIFHVVAALKYAYRANSGD